MKFKFLIEIEIDDGQILEFTNDFEAVALNWKPKITTCDAETGEILALTEITGE